MDIAGGRDLADWIEYRADELRLFNWTQLAEDAGVSRETLRKIRSGEVERPRRQTKRAIERVLEWRSGSIDDIAKGLPPTVIEHRTTEDPPMRRRAHVEQVPDGLLDASRAELNRVADWIATWRGEGAAEDFLDWATTMRTQHRNPGQVTDRDIV